MGLIAEKIEVVTINNGIAAEVIVTEGEKYVQLMHELPLLQVHSLPLTFKPYEQVLTQIQ